MKKQMAELVIKGDRLYVEQKFGHSEIRHDVTGLWHFFKEYVEFMKQPTDDEWTNDKIVSDTRDLLLRKQAQEDLLEEIGDIADHHETDSWDEIKKHLTINKPFV